MHRCYAPPAAWSETEIRLAPEEAHHLQHVLRLRPGAEVTVFDGEGRRALARLGAGAADGGAVLAPVRVTRAPPRAVHVLLIQALPKGTRLDLVVEKATELGATAVWPVLTERVVPDARGGRAEARLARWRRLVLSAAKQCGTDWLPRVAPVQPLRQALGTAGAWDVLFCGALEAEARPFREAVAAVRPAAPRRLAVVIGPEGDLTADEYRAVREAGGVAVSFGARVLRTDTAALFALSVLAYEFGTAD